MLPPMILYECDAGPGKRTEMDKTLIVTRGQKSPDCFSCERDKTRIVCFINFMHDRVILAPRRIIVITIMLVRLGAQLRKKLGSHALTPDLGLKISNKAVKAIRKAVKRGKRVRASVSITAKDAAGNSATFKRTVRAKAK